MFLALALALVVAAAPISAASPHQPGSTDAASYWTSRADPLVADVNSAALEAALSAAPSTPGGPYGLAQTPYMGWRRCDENGCCIASLRLALKRAGPRVHCSWNAYHNSVTQELMEAVMDKLVQKQADGSSLLELGYVGVGLDDNWQACGKGFNGTFHAADGSPMWNNATFPDPAAMVTKAHSLKLKAGWYMNNCDCKETGQSDDFTDKIYRQSGAVACVRVV